MTQTYTQDPHLEIQRELKRARDAGATQARLTFHPGSQEAILEHNQPGPGPKSRTFRTRTHPAQDNSWETDQKMQHHLAPQGLELSIINQYPNGRSHTRRVPSVLEDNIGLTSTPDGNFLVYITRAPRYHDITVVKPDGTTHGHHTPSHEYRMGYQHTANREPGTPVQKETLAAVAVDIRNPGDPSQPPEHPSPAQLSTIFDLALRMAAGHIHQHPDAREGYAWPDPDLRRMTDQLRREDPGVHPLPEAPSTSACRVQKPDGATNTITMLTPSDAVAYDFSHVQGAFLDRLLRNFAPRPITPVTSPDQTIPVVRLTRARVTDRDGTAHEYPLDQRTPEQVRDAFTGRPNPSGDRIPNSRVDRVQDILLTLEITHPDGTPTETLSVHSDVYADQDRNHHILLVTQDSEITPDQLASVAFLHNPPDQDLPKEVVEAGCTDPQEWYTLFVRDRLTRTPEEAVREALTTVANAAQYLDLDQAGLDHPVTALSQSGEITVTFHPEPPAGS